MPQDSTSLLSHVLSLVRLLCFFAPTFFSTIAKHYIHGPPCESWPLSTDLFTALARRHAELRSPHDPTKEIDPVRAIQKVRKAFQLPQRWLPEPKSGFAVGVKVLVKRRGLKGVLERFDQDENGERIIEAEWVVHDDVHRQGASPQVVLYFHGGAYVIMDKSTHRPMTIQISKAANCRCFSVNYRLAPETPFPGALHDAIAAFQYLTEDLHIPAANITVAGDSAGGGLSMALLLYLRDSQLPQLGGGILLSPWVDSTSSLKSWESNSHLDYLTPAHPTDPLNPILLYLGPSSLYPLTHPYICSVAAPLSDLPPLLIQVGGAELLRDEGILLAQRASTAGVDVKLELLDGGVHVAQSFGWMEVGGVAFGGIEEWVRRRDPGLPWDSVEVDRVMEAAGRERAVRQKGTRKEVPVRPGKLARAFSFTPVARRPPTIHLRQTANAVVRRAFEENEEAMKDIEGRDEAWSVYLAMPPEAGGLVNRVLGSLHL